MAQHAPAIPLHDTGTPFGHWLRQRRHALKLTPAELAQRAGCSSATLRQIELGRRVPSDRLAELLAGALEVPDEQRQRFVQFARRGRGAPVERLPEPAQEILARPWALHPRAPAPSGELIGRAAELGELLKHLPAGGTRLLTLLGPGGIGKTSLAVHAAARLASTDAYADGVAVALLAAVSSAADVPLAIADALGLALLGERPAAEQLVDALRDRKLLLVLDNCEHLLNPGEGEPLSALVRRLLAEAPGLALLATSRERLHLRDERVMLLEGLAVPPADEGPRVEQAAAVQLFAEQAQRASPSFTLRGANRAAVAHICRRLDGMPLALELAAAWTRVLSPLEIAGELDRALDFLAGADRDTPDRQRSLRAALDHSWRLLDDAERQTLARLSVFRGGCDRRAAAQVVGATLPILAALVDKSLLRSSAGDGGVRYTLHELVHQYAAEHLALDADDRRATEARHTAHYAELLRQSIAAATGGVSPEAWATLTQNFENVRTAWVRAAASGDAATIMGMARGLMLLYDMRSWRPDGAALFGRAAEALQPFGAPADAARGMALGMQGYFLILVRPAAAAPLLEQGITLLERAGETVERAHLLLHLGTATLAAARFEQAHARYAEAKGLATADDHFTRLWATCLQGSVALYSGDLSAAERMFSACSEAWHGHGYSRGEATALSGHSEVALLSGRLDEAEALARRSVQLGSAGHDAPGLGRSLGDLAAVALARGDLETAHYLLTESCTSLRALGDMWPYGLSVAMLIRLHVQRGDLAAARKGCVELCEVVRDGAAILLADAAGGLAAVLAAEGSEADALAVLIALEGLPGPYAALQRAAGLRSELERRLAPALRAAAAQQARSHELLPWLAQLSAKPPAPAAAHTAVPAGSVVVPDSGEILSPREVEVLRLIAGGASNPAIADQLVISVHTVKTHVVNILAKLRVASRTEAALRASALGLTPLERR